MQPPSLLLSAQHPSRRTVLCHLLLGAAGGMGLPHAAAAVPSLMLANVYRANIPLADYWVSEKYDGVRGYWDGRQLWTRGGEPINAPAWFTAGWPAVPMDGELWVGRGQFSAAVSTVRQQVPNDDAWRKMHFMVFDLPAHGGTFDERIPAITQLLHTLAVPWVQPVAQSRVASHEALQARMRQIVKAGGEGLMLHRGASLYKGVRNDDLLKLKPYEDAEARVVAHIPGRGKYEGMLGALLVETTTGQRFKLGTGFTNAERRDPPVINTWVTYRYRDINPSGLPRFASFLRVREDLQR